MADFQQQHENILQVIDHLVQEGLENNTGEPACEDGCYYCCTFPVPVGVLELLYIARKVNEFSEEKKNTIVDNIENAYKYSFKNERNIQEAYYNNNLQNFRTICPFIDNGSCMIYKFRPTNCRTQFSTDVKLCQNGKTDMSFFQTPKVHSLVNMTTSASQEEKPKKGFLHNAFIFDGDDIQVDPIYIFEDDINMENAIKLSNLIVNI